MRFRTAAALLIAALLAGCSTTVDGQPTYAEGRDPTATAGPDPTGSSVPPSEDPSGAPPSSDPSNEPSPAPTGGAGGATSDEEACGELVRIAQDIRKVYDDLPKQPTTADLDDGAKKLEAYNKQVNELGGTLGPSSKLLSGLAEVSVAIVQAAVGMRLGDTDYTQLREPFGAVGAVCEDL